MIHVGEPAPAPARLRSIDRVPRFANGGTMDDQALARAFADSDPRAPAALWDRYSVLVRGLLRRMLGPSADVDDLVQDTFIGLVRTLPGLREPAAFRSFVVGTALRVARGELRRRRVRRFLALTPTGTVPDIAQEGGSDPEARRAVKRLYEVLDGVEDRGRIAFILRYVEGYELAEVAVAIDCSLATAKRVLAKVEERVNAIARREPLLAPYVVDEAQSSPRDESGVTEAG